MKIECRSSINCCTAVEKSTGSRRLEMPAWVAVESTVEGVPPVPSPTASYGRCAEVSAGKDTTTGHWEMAGIHLSKAFPLYPNGFPPDVMAEFERRTGRRSLGRLRIASSSATDFAMRYALDKYGLDANAIVQKVKAL